MTLYIGGRGLVADPHSGELLELDRLDIAQPLVDGGARPPVELDGERLHLLAHLLILGLKQPRERLRGAGEQANVLARA